LLVDLTGMEQGTYVCASDTTIDEDLNQGNDRSDRKLVENKELSIPACGEDLVH
jgi:hypothetical protein